MCVTGVTEHGGMATCDSSYDSHKQALRPGIESSYMWCTRCMWRTKMHLTAANRCSVPHVALRCLEGLQIQTCGPSAAAKISKAFIFRMGIK